MAEQTGDKTEEPTPHRLREAREKGQIAKSREITTAILLLSTYILFNYVGLNIWQHLTQMASSIFSLIPATQEFSLDFVFTIMLIGGRALLFACAPIFLLSLVAAIAAEALQTGFVASVDPLTPKLERINPLEGFKRMFSLQGFVELLKSVIKIVIVFWIAWAAVRDDLPRLINLMDVGPWDAVVLGGAIAYKVAIRVGIFYIAIAILDYLYRRWEYMKNLRMTKQEVKEEYKRLEGDPLVKQRMRDMQRAVAQQRMMAAVPSADVVVTNPVHLAVALRYHVPEMKAPSLIAKGQNLIAEEIKRIAEERKIPVVENEGLAQSLYRTTQVGQEIPYELYQAVAEVLAFVYKLKRERSRQLPKLAAIP